MTDLASILNGYFAAGTVPTALYVGLVDKTNYANFLPGVDTMLSHAGWQEFTAYAEATRQLWTPGVVIGDSPASVNNPGATEVTPSADGIIKGVFLCDNSTKGGTTGTLYGPWFFAEGEQPAASGVVFKVDIKITLFNNTPTG